MRLIRIGKHCLLLKRGFSVTQRFSVTKWFSSDTCRLEMISISNFNEYKIRVTRKRALTYQYIRKNFICYRELNFLVNCVLVLILPKLYKSVSGWKIQIRNQDFYQDFYYQLPFQSRRKKLSSLCASNIQKKNVSFIL